jgi:N-acetylmuramoyl-L-alanine amidase
MKNTILLLVTAITLMSFNGDYTINNSLYTVVIDAAHGGNDSGIKNEQGISEKELTLAIAKQIQQIGEEKGIRIILTRTGDESVTLDKRTNQTNIPTPDLFISLHLSGHSSDNAKSGMECFISEKNPEFKASKKFSEIVTQELRKIKGIGVNEIKSGNFYVLKNNTIPAVILELGYLTNMNDLKFVNNTDNQKVISEKIVTSILKYKN